MPTYREISECFTLWMEYVDPSGIDTETEFNQMSTDTKIEILESCFGKEENKLCK
jgi:hypothetical protein